MVVLIELIIGIRGVLGYVGFHTFWSHEDEQAVTLSPVALVWLLVSRVPGMARAPFDDR